MKLGKDNTFIFVILNGSNKNFVLIFNSYRVHRVWLFAYWILEIGTLNLKFDRFWSECFHWKVFQAHLIYSNLFSSSRSRPSINQMLDHPWISLKTNILPALTLKTSTTNTSEPQQQQTVQTQITPKSTPVTQRKSFSSITDVAKARKAFCADTLNGSSVRTYSMSPNCLCSQCGTACRHITHTPVTKTSIAIDRGILC